MKRILTLLCVLCTLITTGSAKTLLVYYSYTGDCKAVVTKDVPANTIVGGVPAKILKTIV